MQTLKQLQNGELDGATKLTLSEGLTEFPQAIFRLADTLEMLDLSKNKLSSLPADFGRLHNLKIFFCSENQFTVLPEVLGDCPLLDICGFKANIIEEVPAKAINPNLRWFILTNNRISTLPAEIGNCPRMQKLMLAGNRLEELPQELSNCKELGLLRISANRLKQLPVWLLSMPKLSWLAFSGNRFSEKPSIPASNRIKWSDLEVTSLLGEGASGMIYKAHHQIGEESIAAAIKVFKGSVTSDGFPEDEIDICITAGPHPGLVQVIGEIEEHPENKKALLMDLIPSHFYNLGQPPSFESCTRDVYKPGQSLAVAQVVKIAATIASVASQLHSKGIMHSDLYAHNILVDEEGKTLFGDFGAACFYNKAGEQASAALERLEVRAYGYLLEDLINLCSATSDIEPAIQRLFELKETCLSRDVQSRPSFDYLAATTADLAKA